MQAIFELIGALLLSIAGLITSLLALVFDFVTLLIEFAVVALWRGRGAAKQRYAERRQANIARRKSFAVDSQKNKTLAVPILLGISLLLIAIGCGLYFEHLQHQRKEQTERQIVHKAEDVIEQIKKTPKNPPEPGLLAEFDAWGRPLELFVDKLAAGTLIVVRSVGRDGRSGTLDDQLAIKASHPAVDIGEEIAKRAVGKLKKFLK